MPTTSADGRMIKGAMGLAAGHRQWGCEILAVDQMYAADKAAMTAGVSGLTLMEAAGAGVTRAIIRRWAPRPTIVLCGPGNNGGDGFVIARLLAQAGAWDVRVALLGTVGDLKGDARVMAEAWSGQVIPLAPTVIHGQSLIVDALFGAGLSREVDGVAKATITAANDAGAGRVAVDIPSGIHGDTGTSRGINFKADLTVTFFRKKPAHLLLPGRMACGVTKVVDIGIPNSVLQGIAPKLAENSPAQWHDSFPKPDHRDHKYRRGHAVVVSGLAASTGAARLAAQAALRVGSGLVTVACPSDALIVNATQLTAVMTEGFDDIEDFESLLSRRRRNAILLGPGNGVTDATRANVLAALQTSVGCVLDADALTAFAGRGDELISAITGPCVLTPHDGEFARLFGAPIVQTGKLNLVRDAAKKSGAVVLLKGADTVVAAPDGRSSINSNAPPELATAGTGDVLSGLVVGLVAQGMAPFEATCAAAWLHGAAGAVIGPGLIAEDLEGSLPQVLRGLRSGKA